MLPSVASFAGEITGFSGSGLDKYLTKNTTQTAVINTESTNICELDFCMWQTLQGPEVKRNHDENLNRTTKFSELALMEMFGRN